MISLDDPSQTTPSEIGPSISLYQDANLPKLAPEVVQDRATRYDFAMGEASKGQDYYRQIIELGKEEWERNERTIEADLEESTKRKQLISQFLNVRAGGTLTAEDTLFLDTLSREDIKRANPDTIFEQRFGQRAVSEAPLEPQAAEKVGGVAAHQQYLRKLHEELEAEYNQYSTAAGVAYTAMGFLPFYSWIVKKGAIEDAGGPEETGFLPGNNRQGQVDWFYNTDLNTAAPIVSNAAREMFRRNPTEALAWLSEMIEYSGTSQFLGNLTGVLDMSIAVPGGGIIPLAVAKNAAKSSAKVVAENILRTSAAKEVPKGAYKHAQGKLAEVADSAVLEKVFGKAAVTGQVHSMVELAGEVPALLNPASVTGAPTNAYTSERIARMTQKLTEGRETLLSTLTDPLMVQRLEADSEAMRAAMDVAKRQFELEYSSASDRIIDVRPVNNADTLGGVDAIALDLGNADALPFKSKNQAKNIADNMLRLKNSTIVEVPGGYVIRHVKTIDETATEVRDLLTIETHHKTPVNIRNMIFGWFRTADDLLPADIARDMKVATYGSSALLEAVKGVAKDIGNLSRTSRENLKNFLDYQKDLVDDKGLRGWNSRTLAEFEVDWHSRFGVNATEQEADAYFAFRQLHDFDYVVRNLGIYRDRVRLGLQENIIRFRGTVPKVSRRGNIVRQIETAPIVGKTIDELPYDVDWDAGVAILDSETGSLETFRKNIHGKSSELRQRFKNLQRAGYKLIQLTNNGWDAFKTSEGLLNVPQGRIQFMFVKDVETRPLSFKQVPYRMGSHVEYTPGWYIRQAQIEDMNVGGINKYMYSGDVNVLHFQTEGEAKFWLPRIEKARQMYLDKDPNLQNYVETQTPFAWDRFNQMWRSDKNPNGLLNPRTPLMMSATDATLDRAYKLSDLPEYRDREMIKAKDSPYNLEKGVNLEYAGERDRSINTIITEGSPEAPIYKLEPARTIDPLALLHRNTGRLLASRHLDDLKLKTAARFVEEFGQYLKGDLVELRRDPVSALFNGDWREGADRTTLAAAKNFRRTAIGFFGMKNDTQRTVDMLKQKVADQVMKHLGPKAFQLVDTRLLSRTNDPVHRMRQFAFDVKLGLFNPVQLFLQAQTWVHTAAIEGPVNTGKAMAANTLFAYLRYGADDKSIKAAAKTASKMGWKEDEFIESYNAYRQSGMYVVGGEHGHMDDLLDPKVFHGKFGTFLDKGRIFFQMGERGVRNVAWNAAYLRWRQANPGKRFDNAAKTEVLNRADLLTMNMSRASNAAWQRGFASLPTQFFGYHARLMDQMLGKRLTWPEKLKVSVAYSTMYGIPAAGGAWVGGLWEPGEDLRRELINRGIEYDDTVFEGLVDGLPSMMMEWALGTDMNWNERYGPNGLPWLRELWEGDTEFADLVFGVSGSILKDTWALTNPFWAWFASAFNGTEDEWYTLTPNDFLRPASNISAVEQGRKLWDGIAMGKWFTKTGQEIGEVSQLEAGLNAVMGVQPQSFEEMYRLETMDRNRQKRQLQYRKDAIQQIQSMWRGYEDDLDSPAQFHRNATILMNKGDFTPQQRVRIFKDAVRDNGDRFEQTMKRWMRASPDQMKSVIRRIEEREKELGNNGR